MHSHGPNSSSVTDRRFGRRSLIKAIGAGAAAVSFSTLTQGVARAEEEMFIDAIIIGAGYAGGTVARDLARKGMSSLVLEAKDRIGGRIFTGSWAGESVEIGGQWVAAQHNLVNAELTRYGIKTYMDPEPNRVMVADGTAGAIKAVTPTEATNILKPLWTEFYKGSEQYFERPNTPLYRKDLLAAVDPLTLADRFKQMGLAATDLAQLTGEAAVYSGGSSSLGSLTGMAQWYQLSGGTYESYSTLIGRRPEGGMTRLLQSMITESKATVRFNSPVAKVTDSGSRVVVETTAGRRYAARVVIVCTAVNVWKNITFAPGLPKAHTQLMTQGMDVPHGTKMWLQIKGSKVDATTGTAPEGSGILMMVPQKQLADRRLMIAFPGPGLNVNDPAAVQAAVRQWIPGAEVLESRAMEWAKDPYTGSWGYRKVNQLLQTFPQIEQPHGRILFAGADIAHGWHGAFIEGAVESGKRAAKQALALA